jgi:hypothetical protein
MVELSDAMKTIERAALVVSLQLGVMAGEALVLLSNRAVEEGRLLYELAKAVVEHGHGEFVLALSESCRPRPAHLKRIPNYALDQDLVDEPT